MPAPTASIVLLTKNAGEEFGDLLAMIQKQTLPPHEVILLDSRSTDETVQRAKEAGIQRLYRVNYFTHGGTRNLGARLASGEFVVYITQDAVPANEFWLEALIKPFTDPKVAGTFSRQLPRPDVLPMEEYFMMCNFPEVRIVRPLSNSLGMKLKDIFFANVSSAIRREVLLKHPFNPRLIMSEDQQFALAAIENGYKTVYEPCSMVIHSHNYSLKKIFGRYFDSAVSLIEVTRDSPGTYAKTGVRYVLNELEYLRTKHPAWLPYAFMYDLAKAAGTYLGMLHERLPLSWKQFLSLHPYHWNYSEKHFELSNDLNTLEKIS